MKIEFDKLRIYQTRINWTAGIGKYAPVNCHWTRIWKNRSSVINLHIIWIIIHASGQWHGYWSDGGSFQGDEYDDSDDMDGVIW